MCIVFIFYCQQLLEIQFLYPIRLNLSQSGLNNYPVLYIFWVTVVYQ